MEYKLFEELTNSMFKGDFWKQTSVVVLKNVQKEIHFWCFISDAPEESLTGRDFSENWIVRLPFLKAFLSWSSVVTEINN